MRRQNNFYWPLPPPPLSSAGMQAPVFREQSVQRAVSRGQDGGCMWPVASCVTLGETLETVMSKLITIINARDTNPPKLTDLRLTIG